MRGLLLRCCAGLLALSLPAAKATASGGSSGARLAPELAVGARVEVKGRFLDDGSLLADELELQTDDDTDEELRGNIDSIDVEHRRLTMLGFTVQVPADARIQREPRGEAQLADLTAGLRVKVDGRRDAGGIFVARKIRIRRNQYAETKLVGFIESVETGPGANPALRVLGVRVVVSEATELAGKRGDRPALRSRRVGFVDDDDLIFTGRNRIGKHVAYAGELRLKAEVRSNADLEEETDDREVVPEVAGVVGFSAWLDPLFLYAEIIGQREYFIRGGEGFEEDEDRGDVRVGEAYVELRELIAPGLSLALGRQKFNEDREWFYNRQNLDAARLIGEYGSFSFQASISRDLFDESRNLRDQDRTNYILEARWEVTRDLALEGFYVDRRDRTDLEESPRITGLRFLGEPGRRFDVWADLALEGGTRGSPDPVSRRVSVRDVRAHAFDVGFTFRPRIALDPTFTAGFALGSGDEQDALPVSERRGEDRTFRQSGMQRNKDKYNGVVSFRYYGEAFDPELANLRILTLGAGLRPIRPVSLDVIYHRYRQDVAVARIINDELDARPDGIDPELGSEWDVAIGYEPGRRMELRLTAGWFRPGGAFADDASSSTVVRFQSKFRF